MAKKLALGLDRFDRRILEVLQQEGPLPLAEMSARVGLSATPCWRRMQRMRQEGLLGGYTPRLDRHRLGWGVMVFVLVQVDRHDAEAVDRFAAAASALPEVVACHSVSGSADFLLQVVAADLEQYGDYSWTVLGRLPGLKSMQSTFVLAEHKPLRSWPLPPEGSLLPVVPPAESKPQQ